MTDASKQILKSAKCARVIACISDMFHVSLQEATDIYYESETADLIDDGVADKIKFHAKGYFGFVSNTTIQPNQWYFIVCVYDRVNLQMRIYINGSLDNTYNFSSTDTSCS